MLKSLSTPYTDNGEKEIAKKYLTQAFYSKFIHLSVSDII